MNGVKSWGGKVWRGHVSEGWRCLRSCGGEGEPHLVHTIQELQEDGSEAAALAAGTQVAPLAELVAKGQPLFLQQHLETLQSPVERIAQQLHQRHHLQTEREKVKVMQEKETGQYKTHLE